MDLVGTGPGRLVDVGCGFGHFVRWALGHDWDAFGYDLDPWAIERSVASGRVTNDLETIGSAIDVLTMWDVLEHQTSPISFLEQWMDRLRDGGRIIVGVPNFQAMKLRWPVLRLDPRRFSNVVQPEEHAVQFTSFGLCLALQRAGFDGVVALRPPPSRHPNRALTWLLRTWPAFRGGLFATGNVPSAVSR